MKPKSPDLEPTVSDVFHPKMTGRRDILRAMTAGSVLIALGGATYVVVGDEKTRQARKLKLADGRPRLPPNQHLIERIRPMGGEEGDPSPGAFRLNVHGEVDAPYELDFAGLLAMPQSTQTCDVHCVTKWSLFDSHWTGVKLADLAARAKVKASAHYVIFEAAFGYTANVLLREALRPNVLVAHKYEGTPLARAHGAPVRALVPDLYFWKSAKWLTGIRFAARDAPGYWENRGYHNHADPWAEERYS
ncbi:MAG TPA: molybdopterin-dependent oxidoreductase [Polyangiaceae bacterium]